MAKQAIDEFNDYFTEKKREKEAAAKALRKRVKRAVENETSVRIARIKLVHYKDEDGDPALLVEIWLKKEARKIKPIVFSEVISLAADAVRDADDTVYPLVIPHFAKGQPLDSKLA